MMTDVHGHGPHEILPWALSSTMYSHLSWAPDGSALIVSNGGIQPIHPSTNGWEWEVETVIGWSGEQNEPAIFPQRLEDRLRLLYENLWRIARQSRARVLGNET